jgi:hypothetical protein
VASPPGAPYRPIARRATGETLCRRQRHQGRPSPTTWSCDGLIRGRRSCRSEFNRQVRCSCRPEVFPGRPCPSWRRTVRGGMVVDRETESAPIDFGSLDSVSVPLATATGPPTFRQVILPVARSPPFLGAQNGTWRSRPSRVTHRAGKSRRTAARSTCSMRTVAAVACVPPGTRPRRSAPRGRPSRRSRAGRS